MIYILRICNVVGNEQVNSSEQVNDSGFLLLVISFLRCKPFDKKPRLCDKKPRKTSMVEV